jgi:hypothetical protein
MKKLQKKSCEIVEVSMKCGKIEYDTAVSRRFNSVLEDRGQRNWKVEFLGNKTYNT